jgi:hypothetical protein
MNRIRVQHVAVTNVTIPNGIKFARQVTPRNAKVYGSIMKGSGESGLNRSFSVN